MHADARHHRLFCEFILAKSIEICTHGVGAKSVVEQISDIFEGIPIKKFSKK